MNYDYYKNTYLNTLPNELQDYILNCTKRENKNTNARTRI